MGLITQLVAWIIRPRNVGMALLSLSSVFLIAIAGGVSIKVEGIPGIAQVLEFSPADGLPMNLLSLVVYLAGITWFIGLAIVIVTLWREWREADTRRVLVVEMRGLVDTSDRPLLKMLPRAIPGRRVDCLVNVRPLLSANPPSVEEALKEISHVQREVRRARGDTARENVQVVAGGIMQVPLLFYAGTLLDDNGHVLLFEWERTKQIWKQLDEEDDGSRFNISGIDEIGSATDVVLAVSASYLADLDDIEATFPTMPLVHMARPTPEPNTLWSYETQAALTQQFLTTLATLANCGVKTVHLVLAAPASLSIRFGMAYDHRNMPKLRCYQREREHEQIPPYPWSVQMPPAGQPAIYLPTTKPAVIVA